MYKRSTVNVYSDPTWLDIKAACNKFSLGRDSIRKIAEEAGALSKVGKRVLINADKVNEYLINKGA